MALERSSTSIPKLDSDSLNKIIGRLYSGLSSILEDGQDELDLVALHSAVDYVLTSAEASVERLNGRLGILKANHAMLNETSYLTGTPANYIDKASRHLYIGFDGEKVKPTQNSGIIKGAITLPTVYERSRVKGLFGNILATATVSKTFGYHPYSGFRPDRCLNFDSNSYWYECAVSSLPITGIPEWAYHTSRWVIQSDPYVSAATVGSMLQLDIEFDIEAAFNQIVLDPFCISPMRILDIRLVDTSGSSDTLIKNGVSWIDIDRPTILNVGTYYSKETAYAKRIELVFNQPHPVSGLSTITDAQFLNTKLYTLLNSDTDPFTAPMRVNDSYENGIINELVDKIMDQCVRDGSLKIKDVVASAEKALLAYIEPAPSDQFTYQYIYGLRGIDIKFVEHERKARFVSKPIPIRRSIVSLSGDIRYSANAGNRLKAYIIAKHGAGDAVIGPLSPNQKVYFKKAGGTPSDVPVATELLGDGIIKLIEPTMITDIARNTDHVRLSKPVFVDWWAINVDMGGDFGPNSGLESKSYELAYKEGPTAGTTSGDTEAKVAGGNVVPPYNIDADIGYISSKVENIIKLGKRIKDTRFTILLSFKPGWIDNIVENEQWDVEPPVYEPHLIEYRVYRREGIPEFPTLKDGWDSVEDVGKQDTELNYLWKASRRYLIFTVNEWGADSITDESDLGKVRNPPGRPNDPDNEWFDNTIQDDISWHYVWIGSNGRINVVIAPSANDYGRQYYYTVRGMLYKCSECGEIYMHRGATGFSGGVGTCPACSGEVYQYETAGPWIKAPILPTGTADPGFSPTLKYGFPHPLSVEVNLDDYTAHQDRNKEEFATGTSGLARAISQEGEEKFIIQLMSLMDRTSYRAKQWGGSKLNVLDTVSGPWATGDTDWDAAKPAILLFSFHNPWKTDGTVAPDAPPGLLNIGYDWLAKYTHPIQKDTFPVPDEVFKDVYLAPISSDDLVEGDLKRTIRYIINSRAGEVVFSETFINAYGLDDPDMIIKAIYWCSDEAGNSTIVSSIGESPVVCRNITNYFSLDQPVMRKLQSDPSDKNYYPVIEYLHIDDAVYFADTIDGTIEVRYETLLPAFRLMFDLETDDTASSPLITGVAADIRTSQVSRKDTAALSPEIDWPEGYSYDEKEDEAFEDDDSDNYTDEPDTDKEDEDEDDEEGIGEGGGRDLVPGFGGWDVQEGSLSDKIHDVDFVGEDDWQDALKRGDFFDSGNLGV